MSISKLRCHFVAVSALVLCCNQAQAQQRQIRGQPPLVTLTALISQGFEIKAAANTGGSAAQVFVQKGKDVFICLVIQPMETGLRESHCSPVN